MASGNISGAIDALSVAQTQLAAQQSQLQIGPEPGPDRAGPGGVRASRAAQADRRRTSRPPWPRCRARSGPWWPSARRPSWPPRTPPSWPAGRAVGRGRSGARPANHGPGATTRPAGPTGRVLPNLPAAGGAATAIAAAESQIGVPYVWGGESPGQGFDCSGLTQWAWRQAGVDLPRTAAAQYDAIAHVPLSDLQPGDLLFWGVGGISHVGMYVGGGDIINAPETGELVRVEAIWNNGLVGAGRP